MTSDRSPPLIRRRELIAGAGTLGLTALPLIACAGQPAAPAATGARLIAGTACPVTPRQTEGPFYFDPALVRSDIAEGKPGVPLRLRLQIVDAAGCAPGPGARVDVWHCDAGGTYSGYDRERTRGARWLRGTQLADARGVVEFATIWPGWYEGRAPHIHVKAWLGGRREITSQIYFDDALSDRIYAEGPYGGRGGRRLRNGDDFIFGRLGPEAPLIQAERSANGYDGAIVIALA